VVCLLWFLGDDVEKVFCQTKITQPDRASSGDVMSKTTRWASSTSRKGRWSPSKKIAYFENINKNTYYHIVQKTYVGTVGIFADGFG
jgi:hypothetical protein